MATVQHPILGQICGTYNDRVAQYLGIKYASLKHRFGTPELCDGSSSSSTIDATTLGPAAIGSPNACQLEHRLIQKSLSVPDFPPALDTECLNLTVTVPHGSYTKRLPVFVFIHGGALAMGSGSWPQYDHAAFVRRSIELGKPVIGVNINYRTGIFGFLTSEEMRNSGFKANNGLRDQKVAFQWIQKYISGFNGDPNQVTAVGQSAGGISACLQLQNKESLFHRLVDLSGTCLLLRPVPLSVHEAFYSGFCEAQGLTGLSGEERIQAIETLDSLDMLMKMPPHIPSLPALDEDFLHTSPTFENVKNWSTGRDPTFPGLRWCKALLIGDCQHDGNIYQLALGHHQAGIANRIEVSFKRNIPRQEARIDGLLQAYGISTAADDHAAYLAVLEFGNDICFYLPAEVIARNWPGISCLYHLNEKNPWEGPFTGQATHIFDVALLFKNFDHKLDVKTAAVGQAFGDNIISFINGDIPWQPTTIQSPMALVYGGPAGEGQLVEDIPENVGRRSTIFEFEKVLGSDNLLNAFIAFLGGH